MSFCVASCFTCSPRASSASTTSASSPIEGVPLSCHGVSLLSRQFHRKPNQNPRPHQPPSPYGAAGVEVKLCLRKVPVAAGVVGSVDRRSKELWENRFLVFPQLRHFPQRFRLPNFHLRCWRSGKT